MKQSGIVLHFVDVDDAALRKDEELTDTQEGGIKNGDLGRASTLICQQAGWEAAAVEFREGTRVAESNLVQKRGTEGVGQVQADLLIAPVDRINLSLRASRSTDREVRLTLLLEEITGEETIFAGQLKID